MQYVWFKTQEDEDLSLGTREILNDLAKNSLVDPLSILLFSFIFFYGSVLITFTAAFLLIKKWKKETCSVHEFLDFLVGWSDDVIQ